VSDNYPSLVSGIDDSADIGAGTIWTCLWDAEPARRPVGRADCAEHSPARGDFPKLGENHQNRLIRAETYPGDSSPRQIRYHYDHLSRCFLRQTYYWNATTGVWYVATTNRWVYDGWNRIALLSPSGTVTEEYLWGLDLSGSMQGAGGVGGLLLWSRTYDSGASWQSYYPCYDGNGNVTELLDDDGERAAQWEYDPFGNTVASAPAPANWASPVTFFPYRFSTKPLDPDIGLYYYGYRWCAPSSAWRLLQGASPCRKHPEGGSLRGQELATRFVPSLAGMKEGGIRTT